MTDGGWYPNDPGLESTLVDLGRRLAYPPPPDVSLRVSSHLWSDYGFPARPVGRLTGRRRLVIAMLAVMALVVTTLGASANARAAVAQWFGLPGVQISVREPVLAPGRLGRTLPLGRRVQPTKMQTSVGFHVMVPTVADLKQVNEVYIDRSIAGGRVSLLWHARPGLPPASTGGAGLLLSEFRGTARQVWLGKNVGWRTIPLRLSVGGYPGYWVHGTHVVFWYRSASGRTFVQQPQLAGNTLLWERDGVTLRLESGLSERVALRIARSVR